MMWRMRQVAGLLAVLALHAAGLGSAAPPACAAGPRVDEPALVLIPHFSYSAPYEELRLKP
jgi:hypothetical protein